jgi:hypothetical protein
MLEIRRFHRQDGGGTKEGEPPPMARPHCMFVQAQDVPWQKGFANGAWPELDVKLLSLDDATGACTAIVRYPAGWDFAGNRYLTCHEELLVLSGALEINGEHYTHHCYANLPKGWVRERTRTPDGAVVLTMLSAAPKEETGVPPGGFYDEKLLVPRQDIAPQGLETWTENPYTRYIKGTGVRPLRQDPYTGEISILYSALPFRYMAKRWTHPVVQEMFVLAGEYAINDVGVMCPGSYAWWRENELHGPYGSLTGFMMFIRTDGGPLSNIIPPEPVAVDYQAPYHPVLPDRLKPYAKPPVRQTLY